MTLSRDNLELFEEQLNRYAGSILTPEDLIPVAEADMVCRLDEVSLQVVEELELLQPFGMGILLHDSYYRDCNCVKLVKWDVRKIM